MSEESDSHDGEIQAIVDEVSEKFSTELVESRDSKTGRVVTIDDDLAIMDWFESLSGVEANVRENLRWECSTGDLGLIIDFELKS